jgi:hypothetical protein
MFILSVITFLFLHTLGSFLHTPKYFSFGRLTIVKLTTALIVIVIGKWIVDNAKKGCLSGCLFFPSQLKLGEVVRLLWGDSLLPSGA